MTIFRSLTCALALWSGAAFATPMEMFALEMDAIEATARASEAVAGSVLAAAVVECDKWASSKVRATCFTDAQNAFFAARKANRNADRIATASSIARSYGYTLPADSPVTEWDRLNGLRQTCIDLGGTVC